MRRKDLLIIVAVFVVVTFGIVAGIYYAINGGNVVTDIAETVTGTKTHHSNGWETAIVDKIIDDVPIPVGYTYIEGKEKTGLIIKNNETQEKYMWIPDQNVDKEIYQEIASQRELKTSEEGIKDNIKKYGGFYVEYREEESKLGEIEELAFENVLEERVTEEHKITREEKMLIEQMSKNIGIEIQTENIVAMTLTSFLIDINNAFEEGNYNVVANSEIEEIAEDDLATKIKDKNGDIAYIPKEFEYDEGTVKDGLKIKSGSNMSFIWIPVEDVNSVKTEFNRRLTAELENTNTQEYNKYVDNTLSDEYKELVASIDKYGGFYISEAELGYDEQGEDINIYRPMYDGYVSNGDYYRNVSDDNYASESNYSENDIVKQKQLEFTNDERSIYEKAVEKSSELFKDSETVVSHLTYGLEYDATVLYLLENCEKATSDKLFYDSTNIGKYMTNQSVWDEENELNGIYGLGGDLAEVTQEGVLPEATQEGEGNKVVVRGGSWDTEGKYLPLASKVAIEQEAIDSGKQGTVGSRASLYIKPEYDTERWEEQEKEKPKEIVEGSTNVPGTKDNPYLIENAEQLAYLAKKVNEGNTCEGEYYRLANDIDLSGKKWTPIGKIDKARFYNDTDNGTVRVIPEEYHEFKGSLDGAGYVIKGINSREEFGAGLIGVLSGNGEVKNITIVSDENDECDEIIQAGRAIAGGIVAWTPEGSNTLIHNCINNVEVKVILSNGTSMAGGIIGYAQGNTTVTFCQNYGNVTAYSERVGGIIGEAQHILNIEWCENHGIIKAEAAVGENGEFAGGIIGVMEAKEAVYVGGTGSVIEAEEGHLAGGLGSVVNVIEATNISNCINKGEVIANKVYAGGIIGTAIGNIKVRDCDNYTNVKADRRVGGIIGEAQYILNIEMCENHGKIEAEENVAGGILGGMNASNISDCTNNGEIIAENGYVGGMIGITKNSTVIYCMNKNKIESRSGFCWRYSWSRDLQLFRGLFEQWKYYNNK